MSTTGSLANDGNVYLDLNYSGGGSSLTLAGALTNRGSLDIYSGDRSDKVMTGTLSNTGTIVVAAMGTGKALLDVTDSAGFGAAGVLSGTVYLYRDSAIEFANGQITSVAGQLTITGNSAFLEDSTALGSNSALTGLTNVAGFLDLSTAAPVSTTGALVNSGTVFLDPDPGQGGSSLTLAGALTNQQRRAAHRQHCAIVIEHGLDNGAHQYGADLFLRL